MCIRDRTCSCLVDLLGGNLAEAQLDSLVTIALDGLDVYKRQEVVGVLPHDGAVLGIGDIHLVGEAQVHNQVGALLLDVYKRQACRRCALRGCARWE